MRKIFLTDGNLRSTLAVLRSLGRAGEWVGVGAERKKSLAGASRHCRECLVYPAPQSEPEAFLQFLREQLQPHGYTHLLATSDLTAQLVAPLTAALAPSITVMNGDATALEQVQDKALMVELASEVGLSAPRYITACGRDALLAFAEEVGYPVVVKPRRSRQFVHESWRTGQVRYAWNPVELLDLYEHCPIPDPLVQERVPGEGRGVFLLMWNGEVKAAFSHRRLREKPPWGGVSVLSESIPLDWPLVEKATAMLRLVKWQGPAMVEFKQDARTGECKLMEVNGRYWGSLQLAIDAGADFPLAHLRLASGEELAPQLNYRSGVQCRWLLGDLDGLLSRLRATPRQKMLCAQSTSSLRACREFMRMWAPGLNYDVLRWSDPGPGWYELCSYISTNLRLAANPGNGARRPVEAV